jgi:hypothetical protein
VYRMGGRGERRRGQDPKDLVKTKSFTTCLWVLAYKLCGAGLLNSVSVPHSHHLLNGDHNAAPEQPFPSLLCHVPSPSIPSECVHLSLASQLPYGLNSKGASEVWAVGASLCGTQQGGREQPPCPSMAVQGT